MKEIENKWLRFLYGTPFKIIGFFYRAYTINRNRVTALVEKSWAALFFRAAMIVTLIVWIAIWYFASDENRNKLTEAVTESINKLNPSAK